MLLIAFHGFPFIQLRQDGLESDATEQMALKQTQAAAELRTAIFYSISSTIIHIAKHQRFINILDPTWSGKQVFHSKKTWIFFCFYS